MLKQQIIEALKNRYQTFAEEVSILTEEEFLKALPNKWAAGQHLDHLCRSLWPLTLALRLPVFVPRLLFGKANRASKTYEELVAKYLKKIAEGGKAGGPYIPKAVDFSQKKALLKKMDSYVNTLCRLINAFSEPQLDAVIMPHPLLGKVTLREMLYFTVYHAEHHKGSVLKNFEG